MKHERASQTRLRRLVVGGLALVLAGAFGGAQAQSSAPVAGKDYVVIPNGTPLEPEQGKVVVEEFFNYVCPACNVFEPQFVAWQGQLPSYVKVVLVPATFRQDFLPYAYAFYAAKSLGLVDKTHAAVFAAIHRTHTLPAEGDAPDEKKIADFYAQYGVTADEFLKTMHSFGVEVAVRRATDHLKRMRVMSTPSIVIDGRYLVRGQTYADMLRIANYLIEQEHAAGR